MQIPDKSIEDKVQELTQTQQRLNERLNRMKEEARLINNELHWIEGAKFALSEFLQRSAQAPAAAPAKKEDGK
jgi:hypothetical protein